MLPLQQAYEVRTAVLDYIRATFHFKDTEVDRAFYRFIEDEKNGLFKGPYISLKTPFVKAQAGENIPLEIKPDFEPHKHQIEAFQRLTTRNEHDPQPTLLTTGTGSGKTECFLYPILDYVYKIKSKNWQEGVKVIIMYPMNALASDQAKRLAEAIWGTEDNHPMRNIVKAGLFIGESEDKNQSVDMEEHRIIENRDDIVKHSPDILLTNFKMLDYSLMQQRYMPLWNGNVKVENPMLRFIVLDELHTYDGAQGTDVANLIRRLKLKLNLKEGMLTPIGTSATLGNGEDSKSMLCKYASDVFGVEFTKDSVIEEHREGIEEFFDEQLAEELPTEQSLRTLNIDTSVEEYIKGARKVWLSDCPNDSIVIGKRLRGLQIVHDLLKVTNKGVMLLSEVKAKLAEENPSFRELVKKDPHYGTIIVESLLALISEAKIADTNGNPRFPLLNLQIQLWQRELSGIQRIVQKEPKFTWRDTIPRDERLALPMYFCRDCGTSGWLTTKKDTERKFGTDTASINEAFMNNQKEVRLMNIDTVDYAPIDEYDGPNTTNETYYIHTNDLTFGNKDEDNVLPVRVVSRSYLSGGSHPKFDHKCPLCANESIAIVGGRTSTLSSVAVSQIMASDLGTTDMQKRKMLTFSNSVQDAAHLAGFYEVRTFRFLFRQGIQKYLKAIGKPISLSELQVGFKKYWKTQLDGDEYYYRFMPDDKIEQIDLRENYRDHRTGKLKENFKREFDLRVDWEICSEFGFMSQRGRTLEKMGSSATFFKEEDLRKVFVDIKPWLEANRLDDLAKHEDLFLRFANGILHRLRVRGGIDHEFLRMYRSRQLNTAMLNWPRNNEHFFRKHFGGNRVPHMMGYQPIRRGDEILDVTTKGRNLNWFYVYFDRNINNSTETFLWTDPNQDVINDFYKELMEAMVRQNILDRKEASGLANYAIRPDALYIEPATRTLSCNKCGSRMYVAKSDSLTQGMGCLDFKCNTGKYVQIEDTVNNYYRKVYDRANSPRIYANEHTGLLERSKREALERDFKEHPTPQSCNVLTATSTLEMGIDIGDLNVVANTGIPPKPSNFLQRIGRAGRKEGSALILNYAKSEKHDMYYFAEPLSMINGTISTPGCFLEAKDILRRHFYAYCIDSWTSANEKNVITKKIGFLSPLTFDLLTDENFFVNRIKKFVKEHQALLTEKFRRVYPPATQSILDNIFEALDDDDSFFENVVKEFENLLTRINQIKQDRKQLQELLKDIPETDTERRDDLANQHKALRAQEKAIKEQNVVEFMTDAGILPNYAFPETGVKFSATIFSKPAPGDDVENVPDPEIVELIRPARQGVKELAPGNTFYTQKLRMEIKGLNLYDYPDSIREMHFCSKCDALMDDTTTGGDLHICPKCGHDSWHNNKHKFLRFTTATTSLYKTDAVLDDRKEARDKENYHTMKHFQFNHFGSVTSYGLKNVAFGIEFCKDVVLTEVNYGNKKQNALSIEVNSNEHISSLGFVTCKYCGKSTSTIYGREDAKNMHFPYCSHRSVGYPPEEENKGVFEELYLYRTMPTEAIKVLLPIQLFDTEASTQLFMAGLELGMKHFYKSSPEHIKIDSYKEYNKATKDFSNYLVLYDTIPGGTGYLSKLYDKEVFSELLRISYEHIRDCECRLEGKDGCYQCILSYNNQWQRNNLSRERAEELFKSIVDECDHWEDIEGSIGSISTSGVIEDSELERLFVKTMEHLSKENHWIWEKKIDAVNEKYNYVLMIVEDDLELRYNVYPQYRLGPAQGVAKVTKPDFQFICSYAKVGGKEIELAKIAQWSVYLDGYAYHASAENNGFENDFARREAIRQSSGLLRQTWTFTWTDIKPYVQAEENLEKIDGLYIASPNVNMLEDFENRLRREHDSIGRFIFMLKHPDIDIQRKEAFFYIASCWTDEHKYTSSYEHIDDAVRENANHQYSDISAEEEESLHFFIKTNFIPNNSLLNGSAWYPYDKEGDYGDSIRYEWSMAMGLTEINKEDWEDFWRRYNILQFFRNEPVHHEEFSVDLDEILEYFPGLEMIVTALVTHHIPFNTEGGFELMEDGVIVAEAAIKIADKNVVIDDFDEETAETFRSREYKVYTLETFNINEIKSA